MTESPSPSSSKREPQNAGSEPATDTSSAPSSSGNWREGGGRRSPAAEGRSKPAGDRATPIGERAAKHHISLRSLTSLERLRDRVETAAHELKRLREENESLSDRIKELESRPHVDPQGTFLSLDHDPDLLRRKISGFIESIDRYLEKERKSH